MNATDSLRNLSERQLLHRFGDLVRQDRRCTAQMLAAIAEIDERKLWAKHACPSMFAFCVERFHMSESMTAKRIWAARTAGRFPVILQMVARGELHLSAIVKIARHLTDDNHRGLLVRARHKSSREIDALVAELAPRPDVPSRIRALPRTTRSVARLSGGSGSEHATGPQPTGACIARGSERTTESNPTDACTAQGSERTTESNPTDACRAQGSERTTGLNPTDACRAQGSEHTTGLNPADACTTDGPEHAVENCSAAVSDAPNVPPALRPRSQIVPLAPRRYKVEVTVDQETHDKLRMLQDLLGHQIPGADPAIIVSRAIDRLLEDTLKKKAAITDRSRPGDRHSHDPRSDRRTRAIPAAIRREVWRRDGGRCTFVDEHGRRCRGTRCVEYHHEQPYGKGGPNEMGNIALRCRTHNQYEADLDFGREFMRGKRRSNNPHSPGNV